MDIKIVKIENPHQLNLILGQSHFIKTVEDMHEAIVSTVPGAKFGLAFCEASDVCLVRHSGTDPELLELAKKNAFALAAGHSFIVFMRDMYPINVLNTIKNLPGGVPHFLRHRQPGGGRHRRNRAGPRDPRRDRRVQIERHRNRGGHPEAQGAAAQDRLQTVMLPP